MEQRRKYKRLTIPLSIRMKFPEKVTHGHGIRVTSKNVSFDGCLIETEIFLEKNILLFQRGDDPVNLDPFLVSGDHELELNIKLPPDAKIITVQGKIAWYQLDSRGESHYFKAGISLDKILAEHGKHWVQFIRDMAQG